MRTLTSIFSALALTLTLGCGGGDGDDPVAVDAGPTFDAAPTIDAMPTNPPVTTGLGETCAADGSGTCADPATTGCVSFMEGATSGICTAQCATDIAMGEVPPATATQACVALYSGTAGTPLCAINIGAGAGNMTTNYACGIFCGLLGDPPNQQDLGGCPGNLTCTMNRCIP